MTFCAKPSATTELPALPIFPVILSKGKPSLSPSLKVAALAAYSTSSALVKEIFSFSICVRP